MAYSFVALLGSSACADTSTRPIPIYRYPENSHFFQKLENRQTLELRL